VSNNPNGTQTSVNLNSSHMSSHSEVSFPTGDGSKLSFRITRRLAQDVEFVTFIETPWLSCASSASTYMSGSPSKLFSDLAENWRGWRDEKRWADLESRVELAATADALGHITIRVVLKGPNFLDRVEVRLTYEAGALEEMSVAVASMFELQST
jgi:hypothetical protein